MLTSQSMNSLQPLGSGTSMSSSVNSTQSRGGEQGAGLFGFQSNSLQRYDLPPRAKKKRLPAMTPGRIDRFETDKSKSKEMDKSLSSTYLRGETGASVENEVIVEVLNAPS